LGSAALADLELATSTISLPAQAPLLTEGEDARFLYLICSGFLKLTVGRQQGRDMIVRVAGPGSLLGLYAALSRGVYEVSAETLTPAQLRPIERDRFQGFLRIHQEIQVRVVQCICQEYRFALQDACRISLAETVAGRVDGCFSNSPTRSASTSIPENSGSPSCSPTRRSPPWPAPRVKPSPARWDSFARTAGSPSRIRW
jgi:CRP/FNR family transcriptional regulator